jgi:deoxyribonuclease V
VRKQDLISLQEKLKKKLVIEDRFSDITSVGGADVSYDGSRAYATIIVLNYENLSVIDERTIKSKVLFPYVPTFLSFRESEPIIKSFRDLDRKPDILLIDGQGIAHPRGLGLASHVGVLLDTPTIGVAKSVLVGEYSYPDRPGEASRMMFRKKTVGFALKTKSGSKPIYISPGQGVSLESSLEIVRKCLKGYRLPEPIRLAHKLSKAALLKS